MIIYADYLSSCNDVDNNIDSSFGAPTFNANFMVSFLFCLHTHYYYLSACFNM